jgi:hypothetical protein
MKKIAFIVSLLVLSGGFTPAQAAQCKDGTYSSSTGRGTCSGHGGVVSKNAKANEHAANLLQNKQAKMDWQHSWIYYTWLKGEQIIVEPGWAFPSEFGFGDAINTKNETLNCFQSPIDSTWIRCFTESDKPSEKELRHASRIAAPCKNKTKLVDDKKQFVYLCVKNKFVVSGYYVTPEQAAWNKELDAIMKGN